MGICYACAAMVESYQKRNGFGEVACQCYIIHRRPLAVPLSLSCNDICLRNSGTKVCREARLLAGGERHTLRSSIFPDFMEEAIHLGVEQ